ncbi:MAG: hypothetical protein Q8P31_09470, partial [Bacillota bacterium]|nr:hypothetical protein [Bacillota bacterium]
EIGVGCLPCARAHFSTLSGILKEALRFAREDPALGIMHPEVQSRLLTAEEEVNNVERHDWTPEKILNSPPVEREVIHDMLQPLRTLRQDVHDIDSVDKLEKAAADAGKLATDLRIQVLKTKGIDTGRILDYATKIQNGEMSLDEAKQKLRDSFAKQHEPQEVIAQ